MPSAKSNVAQSKASYPSVIVTWGSRLTALGLILLGLHVLFPDFAAWGYGVDPVGDNGKAYVTAAGFRDLSLGLMTLFLLQNHRSALGWFFVLMMIVPMADLIIVLQYGSAAWKVLPHAIGLIGIGVIAFSAFKEQARSTSANMG